MKCGIPLSCSETLLILGQIDLGLIDCGNWGECLASIRILPTVEYEGMNKVKDDSKNKKQQ